MDHLRQCTVKETKKEKKRSLVSSAKEAGYCNYSPEYVRTRRSTNRRRAILDCQTEQKQNSAQFKEGRKKKDVSKQLFRNSKGKAKLQEENEYFGSEVINMRQCQKRAGNIADAYYRRHGKDDNRFTEQLEGRKPPGLLPKMRWPTGWYSDDEQYRLLDINNDYQELEGYSSEKEKDRLYELTKNHSNEVVGDWFIFDDSVDHRQLLYHGQRFKDVSAFRKAIEVFAIREGFNLCVMQNQSDIVSCECSGLACDWLIKAVRLVNGRTFVITEFLEQHNCSRVAQPLNLRSKWISARYLHRWKQRPSISTSEVGDEIEATYGVKCPEWKVYCAANRAKQLLGLDDDDGYAMLHQFKQEMERIDRQNIVLVESERHQSREEEMFKRMFVCCERTSYAFKMHCRGILAVDGWKINNRNQSVMLVAAGLDGNNGILPVAFCEVEVEDLDAWVYFLKNINNALRLDNGKGLCILGDGDNGIEYVVEEYLPQAVYRQCCHRIFTEMVKRFPTAPIQHLFWSACRSTSGTKFFKYMELIAVESQECHDWLKESNWERWALFCMPHWVKCSCVTLTIIQKLRTSFHQYLEMNITRRFAAITRFTADIFEHRRMVVWKWNREKVTPTVRDIIHDRCIDGQRFTVRNRNGTMLELTDVVSSCYHLNTETMSCSCGLWQISGIPCVHACRGIQYMSENVEDYVDKMMSVRNYMSTYASGIMQLPKEYAWKWNAGHSLLPPMDLPLKRNVHNVTDDVTSKKAPLHRGDLYPTTTHNKQCTEEKESANYSEHNDMVTIICTSSSESTSL